MVLARSAGMASTAVRMPNLTREIPERRPGLYLLVTCQRGFVGGFVLIACLLFLVAASRLNRLTLLLAPFEPALIFLYSYTKRFTRSSHLVFGARLGSAPSAAWIAIRSALDPRILVLTALVLCWVAGLNMTVKMG
jgi:4-hydroxybenzoate polyprenyltransferase